MFNTGIMTAESKTESSRLSQLVSPKEYLKQINTTLREKSYQIGQILPNASSLKVVMDITTPDDPKDCNLYFIKKPQEVIFLVSVWGKKDDTDDPGTSFRIEFTQIPEDFNGDLASLPEIRKETKNPRFVFDFGVKVWNSLRTAMITMPIYGHVSDIELYNIGDKSVEDFLPNQGPTQGPAPRH
jgi:hypothetical protein